MNQRHFALSYPANITYPWYAPTHMFASLLKYSKRGDTWIHVLEMGVIITIRSKLFYNSNSTRCMIHRYYQPFVCVRAAFTFPSACTLGGACFFAAVTKHFLKQQTQLSNYWSFLLYSVELVVNKKLFIPLRTLAHFHFPHSSFPARKSALLLCLCAAHQETLWSHDKTQQ